MINEIICEFNVLFINLIIARVMSSNIVKQNDDAAQGNSPKSSIFNETYDCSKS